MKPGGWSHIFFNLSCQVTIQGLESACLDFLLSDSAEGDHLWSKDGGKGLISDYCIFVQ